MEVLDLILNELKDLKKEVNEVRTKDIPSVQASVAGFNTKLKMLEKQQMWSTRLYTILGGAIAVAIAKFTGHS